MRGFVIPSFALVRIGWILVDGGAGSGCEGGGAGNWIVGCVRGSVEGPGSDVFVVMCGAVGNGKDGITTAGFVKEPIVKD